MEKDKKNQISALTITCHDVYNAGAALQAYALQTYLAKQGCKAGIIDYKPDYLSGHHKLTAVCNPKYDRPLIRELYLLAKLPGRLAGLRHKHAFDAFTAKYFKLTRRYSSFDELCAAPPKADIYFAGSDQIWNPIFPNGKDPAFYLEFVSDGIRASYAASFAVEEIPTELRSVMSERIKKFDHISVRESSALNILEQLDVHDGCAVVDPVFLLTQDHWAEMARPISKKNKNYLLVYDFDNDPTIRSIAQKVAAERGLDIYSVFNVPYAKKCFAHVGPQEFLGLISGADFVLSNSFHATAFSIIFEKDFAVTARRDGINTRMQDLTAALGLNSRMASNEFAQLGKIDYTHVKERLSALTESSKAYIKIILEEAET